MFKDGSFGMYAGSVYTNEHSKATSIPKERIEAAIERIDARLRERAGDEEACARFKRAKRNLDRILEDAAVLVKPQPKSNGRVGSIEI